MDAVHDHRQVAARREVEPAQIVEPTSRDGDRPRRGPVPPGTPRRTPVALQQIPARHEPVEGPAHPPARKTRIRTTIPIRAEEDPNRGGRRGLVRFGNRLPAPSPSRHPDCRAATGLVDRRDLHRVLGTGLEIAEVRRTRRRRQIDRIDSRNSRPTGPEFDTIAAHRGAAIVARRRPRDGQTAFSSLHPHISRRRRDTHPRPLLRRNRGSNSDRHQRPRNDSNHTHNGKPDSRPHDVTRTVNSAHLRHTGVGGARHSGRLDLQSTCQARFS